MAKKSGIADAFRAVKAFVATGPNDYALNSQTSYQICGAFSILKRSNCDVTQSAIWSARDIIMERLRPFSTVIGYLEAAKGIETCSDVLRLRELSDRIWAGTSTKDEVHERCTITQTFRHAWLDALIIEFEGR